LDLFAICSKKRRGGQLIAAKNSVLQGDTHSGRRREMSCRAVSEAVDWQVVDRALRGIAARRAALDSEEARWLREAEALQIWRPLGMVSALDYMERVLGYAPRSAQERLRVARALGELPKLDAALAQGRLAFTAARELTRVATPTTEAAWLEAATGKNLRQIEELVADHRLGDGPTDPKDPAARTHVVRFELSASTYARLRQTRQALESERANSLSDDELVALLCEAALAGGDASEADDGRAKFQVAMTVCERCQQGWQEGAGVRLPVDSSTVERAMCDAQHLGSLDGDAPDRAHQDVTPSVARFVRRRDGGRCRVPGCRSARGLEIHHIVHREHGGGHEAGNLILLCSSCHTAHHDGILTIRGTAAALEVERTPSKLDRAIGSARGAHVDAGDGEAKRIGMGRGEAERIGMGGARGAHVDAGGGEAKRIGMGGGEAERIGMGGGEAERIGMGGGGAKRIGMGPARGAHADAGGGGAERVEMGPARGAHADAGGGGAERIGMGRARSAHVDAGGDGAKRIGSRGEAEQSEIGCARGAHVDAGDGGAKRAGIGRGRGAHVGAGGGGAERVGMGGGGAERIEMCAQARRALVEAGWSRAVASSAVAAASARLSGEEGGGSLERLLFEAFRVCPRPRTS
jgi:hypothetical protein